jgi:GPI mannosyltransferase 3
LNVAQDVAIFYGRNRWDYYVTEGLPLLLTTAIPFALWGIYQTTASLASSSTNQAAKNSTQKLRSLTMAVVFTIFSLSLISHKEVRFLYPLLPALHVIAAQPGSRFFLRGTVARKLLLLLLLTFNIALAGYVTQMHQRGVIDVIHHIRNRHEQRMSEQKPEVRSSVAFMMPCHSTPWRSHFIHRGIDAWALTCEPPLNVPLQGRAFYLDEADQFFANPKRWMREHMADPISSQLDPAQGQRPWPEQVIFFEQLLPEIESHLKGSAFRECWRGFNTHWHDDWRRKGDVIVWCRDT